MLVLDKPHRLAEPGAPTFVLGETGLRMNLGGLVLESFPLERRAATLDLVLVIMETAGSLATTIQYNTDLFDAATITRMAGHFATLLHHIVIQPNTRLNALKERLAEADRQQQVTTRKERKETNLHKLKNVKRKVVSKWQLNGDGAL
jgi:non-ribosomal peptide synthetase component F